MKPQVSPLNIIDFAILNLEFNYIEPEGVIGEDLKSIFSKYELDIDFAVHGNEIIQVFIKAEINRGQKRISGYSIMMEAACLFDFNKNIELDEKAKNDIGGFSTIYIALNALRGHISQLTASAPLGRYILPSVDLNDLINQKKLSLGIQSNEPNSGIKNQPKSTKTKVVKKAKTKRS